MIHIGSLKKDMIILEKSEFSMLRNENEVWSSHKNILVFFLTWCLFLEIGYGTESIKTAFAREYSKAEGRIYSGHQPWAKQNKWNVLRDD